MYLWPKYSCQFDVSFLQECFAKAEYTVLDKSLSFVLFIICYIVHSIPFAVSQKFWSLRPVRWCGSTSGRRRTRRFTDRSPARRCCSGARRTTSRTECTSGKPPTRTDHSTAPRGLTLICTRRSLPSLTIVTFLHISLSEYSLNRVLIYQFLYIVIFGKLPKNENIQGIKTIGHWCVYIWIYQTFGINFHEII